MRKQESKLLTSLVEVAPVFFELLTLSLGGEKPFFSLTTTDEYLFVAYGKELDLGIRIGDGLREGGGAHSCMHLRKPVRKEVDGAVYGVPYHVNSQPLSENGQVVGSINVAISMANRETLLRSSTSIESFSNLTVDMMRSISDKSSTLRNLGQEMTAEAVASKKRLKDTAQFITSIKNIADQINLVGVNASIESARAKQAGFAVISKEIRHLADNTKKFVDQIQPFLLDISNSSAVIEKKSDLMNEHFEGLSNSSDEVLTSLNDLTRMVAELKAMSAKV